MTGRVLRLLAVAAWIAVVWAACDGLPWPARVLTTFLLGALPVLLAGQAALADEVPAEIPRAVLYRSSAGALWALFVLALLAADASAMSFADLGLRSIGWGPLAGWAAGVTAVSLVGLVAVRALGVRERALLRYLLPRTRAEKLEFAGVSATAGVTEELVFRGFLIPALVLAGASVAVATTVSCVLFGFLHGYQGVAGTLRAGLLGLLLAVPLLLTGSILPSMLAHAAIDLVSGLWLGPRLVREAVD